MLPEKVSIARAVCEDSHTEMTEHMWFASAAVSTSKVEVIM